MESRQDFVFPRIATTRRQCVEEFLVRRRRGDKSLIFSVFESCSETPQVVSYSLLARGMAMEFAPLALGLTPTYDFSWSLPILSRIAVLQFWGRRILQSLA